MTKITAKLIGDDKSGYRVDLPSYIMIGNPDYKKMTVDVEIPNDEIVNNKIDENKLRIKYRSHKKWKKYVSGDNI